MMILIRLCVVFMAVLVFVPAAGAADTVVLKNGDRITGMIVKKTGNSLAIESEQFGTESEPSKKTITVSWDQIQSIDAVTQLNVVLPGDKTVRSKLALRDGFVELGMSDGLFRVAVGDISFIRNDAEHTAYERLLRPGWGELWRGTGTFGIAGTAGNSRTATYNAGFTADRITRNDKTSVYFSAITASARIDDRSENTAEAVRGGGSYSHSVNQRLFFNVFNDYEYDKFQDLDLRIVLGGGIGYHAFSNDRHRLDLLSGFSYNRSKFSGGLVRNSAEFYWGDEYRFRITSAVALTQSYRIFHDLSEHGMCRMNFDLGLDTRIYGGLTWKALISSRFLGDPAPGRKRTDFMYTTGFGYSF